MLYNTKIQNILQVHYKNGDIIFLLTVKALNFDIFNTPNPIFT